MNNSCEKSGFEEIQRENLRSAGNRRRDTRTLPAELDVASVVLLVRIGSDLAAHTEGGLGLAVGDDGLHLAERAARRDVGLAHVAELAARIQGGLANIARGDTTVVAPGSRDGVHSPGGLGEGTGGGVDGVDGARVEEGGNSDEVAGIRRDLLDEGGDGGHWILYQNLRK
jgi:hypothetical protein